MLIFAFDIDTIYAFINSMIAFAIAIPLLTLTISMELEKSHRYNCRNRGIYFLVATVGKIAAIVGIVLAFWHISPTIGIVFIVSGIIVMILDGITVVEEDWSDTIQFREEASREATMRGKDYDPTQL